MGIHTQAAVSGPKASVRTVERPATWRGQPYTMSYLMVDREVNAVELIDLLRSAIASKLPNPRVITPALINWSSLFHPRFFKSVQSHSPTLVQRLVWCDPVLSDDFHDLSRLWMQSVLFLSGVTLSAAIVQQRFSAGTIGSKLDRLWDAGTLSAAGVAPELAELNLHRQVMNLAEDKQQDIERLFLLRRLFMAVLARIAPDIGVVRLMQREQELPFNDGRFDFVESLKQTLGKAIKAVVVYGSSVSSPQFADIDAVVIVDEPEKALRKLAGISPVWMGKELNLGIYSADEFNVMQRLSGDNLADYGVCIYGELEVVTKPVAQLLARNFSFGVVRQRQQFGMLSREMTTSNFTDDDRRNLNAYFVKIPANVAKGTLGAVGKRWPKEKVHHWLYQNMGFDTPLLQQQAAQGDVITPLACSSLVTGETLIALNLELNVVRAVCDQIT